MHKVCVGDGNGSFHIGRDGPERGPGVETREVKAQRWRPAKAPTDRAGRPPLVEK
jgi:hypothetical protein